LERPTSSTAGRECMATLQLSPCGAPGNAKRPSGNVPEGRDWLLNQCASGLGDGPRVQFAAHGERAIRNDDAESRTSHLNGHYASGCTHRQACCRRMLWTHQERVRVTNVRTRSSSAGANLTIERRSRNGRKERGVAQRPSRPLRSTVVRLISPLGSRLT